MWERAPVMRPMMNKANNAAPQMEVPMPAPPPPPPAAVAKRRPAPAGMKVKGGADTTIPYEAAEDAPNDYMIDITPNTRSWAHPLRKGFSPTERVDLTETVLFTSSNKV